jgi:hypothetical protein
VTAHLRPKVYIAHLVAGALPFYPGEYRFEDAAGRECRHPGRIARLRFMCPVSGRCHVVEPIGWRQPWRRPSWRVTGSVAVPTLYPAIAVPGGWAGYLREGKFVAEAAGKAGRR